MPWNFAVQPANGQAINDWFIRKINMYAVQMQIFTAFSVMQFVGETDNRSTCKILQNVELYHGQMYYYPPYMEYDNMSDLLTAMVTDWFDTIEFARNQAPRASGDKKLDAFWNLIHQNMQHYGLTRDALLSWKNRHTDSGKYYFADDYDALMHRTVDDSVVEFWTWEGIYLDDDCVLIDARYIDDRPDDEINQDAIDDPLIIDALVHYPVPDDTYVEPEQNDQDNDDQDDIVDTTNPWKNIIPDFMSFVFGMVKRILTFNSE